MLEVAATAGREFELEVVARVAGYTEVTALDAARELIVAGVIRLLSGTTYTINHNLTMEWVLHDISEVRRQALRQHVAEAP